VDYEITSATNGRIKALVRLRDRAERDRTGLFLVEGERLYSRAIESGLDPVATYVSNGEVDTSGEVLTVAPAVLDKASYRSHSEGIIGVFEQLGTELEAIELSALACLLIIENIEKPGNLGAMLRSAAAAGVDAVIAVDDTVDVFNPNVIRASTGALFDVPVALSSWAEVGPWLRRHGISVVGASPRGDVVLWDADLSGPVAIVIGAEDAGLSEQAATLARDLVVIPHATTSVDSLNASVTAALFLYEVVRQRRG